MITYGIQYDDSQVQTLLTKLGNDMPEINRRTLGMLSEEVISVSQKSYLRGGHPLNRRTGKLAQSLTYKVDSGGRFADVGTNLVYAAIHEFGGTIRPGPKGFLAWRAPSGEWVFTRKPVRIPQRPYLKPALDDVFQTGRSTVIIERVLREEIAKRVPA